MASKIKKVPVPKAGATDQQIMDYLNYLDDLKGIDPKDRFVKKKTKKKTMKAAKGGMTKKGYASGGLTGTKSKNQPMTMDWFRKTIGTAEGRKLIGSGGGTGSSNSPSMILRKLMEKNTPTFKLDMSSKKKMLEKIKQMQDKKSPKAKAAKGGMMKKKGYAKGGAMKKKGYSMGGMMPERKINPTTGMSMKKGGMIDMRKTGMFSKGGVTKRPRGK